jgi:hypothetical protein
MAQLYVGKRAVSKGIGAAIRKFVVLGFRGPLCRDHSGERLRDSMNDSGVAPRPRRMMRNWITNSLISATQLSSAARSAWKSPVNRQLGTAKGPQGRLGSVGEEADGSRPA